MGIVWHNTAAGEDTAAGGGVDDASVHGELRFLPAADGSGERVKWTAKKWIYAHPLGKARTVLLPLAFYPSSGRAPPFVLAFYNYLLKEFGPDGGYEKFDMAVYAAWTLVVLGLMGVLRLAVEVKRPGRGGKEGKKEGKKKK